MIWFKLNILISAVNDYCCVSWVAKQYRIDENWSLQKLVVITNEIRWCQYREREKRGWGEEREGSRGLISCGLCVLYRFAVVDGCPSNCGNSRGVCLQNKEANFRCQCTPGWTGSDCSIMIELECNDDKDNDGGESPTNQPMRTECFPSYSSS